MNKSIGMQYGDRPEEDARPDLHECDVYALDHCDICSREICLECDESSIEPDPIMKFIRVCVYCSR